MAKKLALIVLMVMVAALVAINSPAAVPKQQSEGGELPGRPSEGVLNP
jgi:hypothetical protein